MGRQSREHWHRGARHLPTKQLACRASAPSAWRACLALPALPLLPPHTASSRSSCPLLSARSLTHCRSLLLTALRPDRRLSRPDLATSFVPAPRADPFPTREVVDTRRRGGLVSPASRQAKATGRRLSRGLIGPGRSPSLVVEAGERRRGRGQACGDDRRLSFACSAPPLRRSLSLLPCSSGSSHAV